jgi:hypothetical protein
VESADLTLGEINVLERIKKKVVELLRAKGLIGLILMLIGRHSRPVVDNEDFFWSNALGDSALKGSADAPLNVIGRNHHGNGHRFP